MSVQQRIQQTAKDLTTSERKIAAAILSDYPFAGLATIQGLAEHAEVSAPSISRFVTKIGFSGYQDFQKTLVSELREGQRSPVDIHARNRRIEGGFLGDFIARASEQMAVSSAAITEDQFNRVCTLMMDSKRDVHLLGGRVSDSLASILSFHLRQMRERIYHLPRNSEVWPEYLLRMKRGDIFFAVDFRRYEPMLFDLCEKVQLRGAQIILMTDKWLSPIAKHAAEVLPVPIESGTLWDTYTPALAVVEALVTKMAEDNFEQTSARIQAWDSLRVIGME